MQARFVDTLLLQLALRAAERTQRGWGTNLAAAAASAAASSHATSSKLQLALRAVALDCCRWSPLLLLSNDHQAALTCRRSHPRKL